MQLEPITLLIRNAQTFNSYLKNFSRRDVAIIGDKIFCVDKSSTLEATQEIDAEGKYLIPGLIDIHMHIESSMLTPKVFATRLAQCGVTTVVTEPHEMANVNGLQGVLDMIAAGEGSPVDLFYGIPSCVPASSPELEGTGGSIDCEDMISLMKNPSVICVGEIMNYRQIIQENNLEISRFLNYLKQNNSKIPIEGHCPSLLDMDLAKFLYLGIDADHTEHTVEELSQRLENGMFMEIQDKMLLPEVVEYLMQHNLYEHFCFVTDDVMADTLHNKGHVNALVSKAISMGMRPEDAIYNATYTPARRMQLHDRGSIAPGKLADFILLDDLQNFKIDQVYKRGKRVDQIEIPTEQTFPKVYYNSVKLKHLSASDFQIQVNIPDGSVTVRAMQVLSKSSQTRQILLELPVKNGVLQWENQNLQLAAVFNRYGSGQVGYGLVTGECHKRGAVATTYAHDNHNLLVVGSCVQDLLCAANHVIDLQGGMVVADGGQIKAALPLPVGGILSDQSVAFAGQKLEKVRNTMIELGYNHYNPIMSVGTLTLAVSPALKITDKGLVDVKESKLVPLVML